MTSWEFQSFWVDSVWNTYGFCERMWEQPVVYSEGTSCASACDGQCNCTTTTQPYVGETQLPGQWGGDCRVVTYDSPVADPTYEVFDCSAPPSGSPCAASGATARPADPHPDFIADSEVDYLFEREDGEPSAER